MVFKGFLQTYVVGFPWLGLDWLLITSVWCEINSIYISEQLLVNNLTKTNNKQASSVGSFRDPESFAGAVWTPTVCY